MDTLYTPAHAAPSRGWVGSLMLLPVCLYVCLSGESTSFLSTASVMLNEAGQMFFGLLWAEGSLLGGVLLQLLLPFAFFAFFARHRFCFGMQVFLVWLGQNLMYVGRFGSPGQDWGAILHAIGLGAHGHALSVVCVVLGGVLFLTALTLPALMEE